MRLKGANQIRNGFITSHEPRWANGGQFLFCCQAGRQQVLEFPRRRRGREAEGGGLLNRYTVKSRIEGSNPSVSASCIGADWAACLRLSTGSLRFRVTMRPQGEG